MSAPGPRSRMLPPGLVVSCLALLLLLVPAVQPLLSTESTCGYDNTFHLWRAVQVESLIRDGTFFSRWAPDMAQGFGFPLFVFVTPTSAYITALFHLAGISWPVALNATFALGILLGALFTLLFVRDLFGPGAGLVAAIAYAYAPFQAYEVFNRGSLWEAFAWAFPPLVVWSVQRWAVRRDPLFLPVGVVSLAALILTHHLFAFLFTPLLVGWVLVAAAVERDRTVIWRGIALAALALGISAFFWLPALGERGWVQSERLLGTWVFDYRENFLSLSELLAAPRSADPSLINDWPPKALGLVPVLVAVLPMVRWPSMTREAKWQVALLLAMSLGFAAMAIPVSRPLWDTVPLLHYVQFPWRFLGPATLCVAALCGAALPTDLALHPPSRRYLLVSGMVLVLAVTGFGWLYPSHCATPDDISLAGMIAWERGSDTIGTTAAGEYLPVWVERMPRAPDLETAYASDTPRVRLRAESLPQGARVIHAEYERLRSTIILETPSGFQAEYLSFYYPGWRATIDGQPVTVSPTEPEGLVSFLIPEGNHTVHVSFGETPLRWTGDTISVLALIGLVTATALVRAKVDKVSDSPPRPVATYSWKQRWPLLALAVLLPSLKFLVVDRVDTPLRHSRLEDGVLENVDVHSEALFDDQFQLLGYDSLDEEIPADQPLEIDLYWQDTVLGGPEYRIGLALKDARGLTWNSPYLRPPRWHRTPPPSYEWPHGSYALTAFLMDLLPGTPPGVYTVTLGVFDQATLAPYPAIGVADDRPAATQLEIPLGQVRVTRPRSTPSIESLNSQFGTNWTVGPVTLVGYNLDRAEAGPGDPFMLTLFWRSDEPLQEEMEAQLHLQDQRLPSISSFDIPLVPGLPVIEWTPGDLWRGQHVIRLPADLESGEHFWSLSVCSGTVDCQPVGEIALGQLQINAPQRVWQPPPVDIATDVQIGDVATLLGAILPTPHRILEPGGAFTITLVWRAEAETDVSYKVFAHLLGPDGEVVAQSDAEPSGWSRPTTGWLPGEIVLDTHELGVPPTAVSGAYTILAGMYTIEQGRLTTADGSDVVVIASLDVR